jgi:sulfatase modifying factor 1
MNTPRWKSVRAHWPVPLMVLFTAMVPLRGTTPFAPQDSVDQMRTADSAAAVWAQQSKGPDRAGMIAVAGGSFQMGSDVDGPVHTVTVSDFWIDRCEVTVAQFRAFCNATRRSMPDDPPWGWKEEHPIVGVSWDDAAAYAAWAGKRLPTEAEWEYAARGGRLTHRYRYSGGNVLVDVAWCDANARSMTHPVGTRSPNELGVYDMSGNAAEWCSDYYSGDYYAMSALKDPTGPSRGQYRVVRGGSFLGDEFDCEVTFRRSAVPERALVRYGFRCAASR